MNKRLDGKALKEEIGIPTCTVMILKKDGSKTPFDLPRLSVGDLKVIKNQSMAELAKAKESGKKATDMWALLLSMSEGADEAKLAKLTEEEQGKLRQRAGIKMFKELDHNLQLKMFHLSLKHLDPEITEETTDWIISYGIEDQGEYMKALMFLPYGKQIESAETAGEVPLGEEGRPPDSTSNEGQLVGEESTSSSQDGTRSRKRR